MAEDERQQMDINMDSGALYREDVFTDRRVGTIHRMTPVKSDGSVDDSRQVIWVGQAQMMTPAGTLPLHFELEADGLERAVEKFGEAARKAADETMERLKELRREAASSIVTPDQLGGGGGQFGGQGGQDGGFQMPR